MINSSPKEPFKSYSRYLKEKYGGPVYRIGVDAGFSCPNRGKDRSNPGCTYCDENGSRAPYIGDESDLKKQVEGAIVFLKKRYKAKQYILYFQAFSSTFAPTRTLKKIYDYGLSLAPFRELIISTRPDCINESKAELLAQYKKYGIDVWIELGLQSASNKTLELIERKHTVERFVTAYKILKNRGIKVVIHLIFGLPGENEKEIMNTIKFVAKLNPDGIKFHNLHIPKNTKIYEEFKKGEIITLSHKRYMEYVIKAIELLPPQTLIMRLTTDTLPDKLISPKYFLKKADFYNSLRKTMLNRKSWQGKNFNKTN